MTSPTEAPSRIEPSLLGETTADIVDLVAALAADASALGSRLHPRSAEGLADLVRVMNCYYSNLIEGHNTTPREIVRALAGPARCRRASAAISSLRRARISAAARGRPAARRRRLPEPASVAFIRWLHRSFYEGAPRAMLVIQGQERRST